MIGGCEVWQCLIIFHRYMDQFGLAVYLIFDIVCGIRLIHRETGIVLYSRTRGTGLELLGRIHDDHCEGGLARFGYNKQFRRRPCIALTQCINLENFFLPTHESRAVRSRVLADKPDDICFSSAIEEELVDSIAHLRVFYQIAEDALVIGKTKDVCSHIVRSGLCQSDEGRDGSSHTDNRVYAAC